MSYHNNMIDVFLENPNIFAGELEFLVVDSVKEFPIGNGDIDVLLKGDRGEIAIVEVKGHQGLLPKFEKKQLPKYRIYFPDAKIFALIGYRNSLNPLDFELRRYL